ncbi:MAG: Ubiquitin fusion degradation protein 4 [Trizodia sp. TS-e1964]|nr:MAG: Ubiquitin fusion degradation protein 4 [Trizodia sp. TS-e1964]
MSPRVTRATARQAAQLAAREAAAAPTLPPESPFPPPAATPTPGPRASLANRKRKILAARESPDTLPEPRQASPPPRRAKRQRVAATEPAPPPALAPTAKGRKRTKSSSAMANPGQVDLSFPDLIFLLTDSQPLICSSNHPASSCKRQQEKVNPLKESPQRRPKRSTAPSADVDVTMKDANPKSGHNNEDANDDGSGDNDEEIMPDDYDRDDDDDPFGASHLGNGAGPPHGISSTLRALTGIMTGVATRLRDILLHLRQKDDPSVQLIALQELSEILLISTEDNLSGHFSPDQFVKELVILMQPSDFGEENPEMMLLACRCIANLMEALPAATANVVYGGAVPILCQKLLEIHFIDLAEQALSTLEKISVEYPGSIVREGGLTACLTYLDFFATSTQRTAVTTAANCCRNIPDDSFPVIRDVMPILLNVLNSNDQKVVEQGCICVSRVVESFRYKPDKLEELVSTDLLRAVLRLLLPGSTNLIGPSIHTQFLRVLSITARASPRLSVELFKMSIVDSLYQILTGVSPPSGTNDLASQIDSVVIMQALIHRPREQVFETLNVICELLPDLPRDTNYDIDEMFDVANTGLEPPAPAASKGKKLPNELRIELLENCKDEVRRFTVILLRTLTDAYSSTVNLSVRQKVLNAQLRMLSNLDVKILEDALRTVPYASHLASILSQQDHPTLVAAALQAAELLLKRMEGIYRYQFYREGVIAEITKLATPPTPKMDEKSQDIISAPEVLNGLTVTEKASPEVDEDGDIDPDNDDEEDDLEIDHDDEEDDEDDEDDGDEDDHADIPDDITASPVSSRDSSSSGRNHAIPLPIPNMERFISIRAQKFLDTHENEKSGQEMREKAAKILSNLQALALNIEKCYLGNGNPANGHDLFVTLAGYFDGDALESITSAELRNSEIVRVLLDVFSKLDGKDSIIARSDNNVPLKLSKIDQRGTQARSAFLEVFMTKRLSNNSTNKSSTTPMSALVNKLQDLLSRAEHFEVVTVHQNSFDGNRSSATSMLAKQLRLKLVADEDSQIPRPYRNIMVSIHAIATFKALDDYLRPRISLTERPRGARHREGLTNALAAFAAAAGLPHTHRRLAEGSLQPGAPSSSAAPSAVPPPGRSWRKNQKTKTAAATPSDQLNVETPASKPTTRRSSRRNQAQLQPPPSPPLPIRDSQQILNQLECADERQLDDDDEIASSGAIDAVLDDLHGTLETGTPPEPAPINMEVASSGKVTFRKDDGSRIATPTHMPGLSSRSLGSSLQIPASAGPSQSLAAARMSFANAIQAAPQDWHIQFSIGNDPIAHDTTIYRAVHFSKHEPEEPLARNVWSAIHSVKFKRVSGPPPLEPSSLSTPETASEMNSTGFPVSLDKNVTTSEILRLLNILHALNANIEDVLAENKDALMLSAEPLTQFVNTKLTAKLNRQLEEPLIVASNCLPSWSEDLARFFPFIFPFETRHLFLQSTSYGYSRSMSRWQNAQAAEENRRDRHRDDRPFLGRLQRQKVRISRNRILESALKVMELYGSLPSVLEVEYFEEVGTGLGPTLEFYSSVSKEFCKKKLKLWRENESNEDGEHAFGKQGLFPAPMSSEQASTENGKRILHLFKMLGKFVARSMLDSRIIDVSFNPAFFRTGDGTVNIIPSLGAVKNVDSGLAKSLKVLKQFATMKTKIDENGCFSPLQKLYATQHIEYHGMRVDDLGLDFTLPGYPSIELIPNGSETPVTIDNVSFYIDRVIDLTLGSGVQKQVDAFRAGFSLVFPYSALKAFTPDELVMLFGRAEEDWSLETLMDSIKADHGFNLDSKSVRNLLQTMTELSLAERREFLQFVTGSPKLPIGGFKSLTPMFTVVCKPSEPPYTSDDYLPSVMTCVNYLKLPDYTDLDVMRKRMSVAIKEGQGAFHLS